MKDLTLGNPLYQRRIRQLRWFAQKEGAGFLDYTDASELHFTDANFHDFGHMLGSANVEFGKRVARDLIAKWDLTR